MPCLGLTRQQDSVIRLILREEKQCSIECKREFQESIKTLRQEYNVKMEKYRRVEKTDEIRKEIEILNFEFRQTQRDLEKEYREKMAVCNKNLNTDIEALLRKDQLTLWNIWKATDLEGDYFTRSTDYGFPMEEGKRVPLNVYYHHGMDAQVGKKSIGTGFIKMTDEGLWYEAQLDMADE